MKHAFLIAAAAASVSVASAHTVTWGYADLGSGSYTVWSGSYHGASNNGVEGRLMYTPVTQSGVSTGSASYATFNLLTLSKPSGLNDGTTNFYSAGTGSMGSTPGNGGSATLWQGVTISGITTGYYLLQYDPTSSFSAVWQPFDASIINGVIIQLGGGGGLGAPTAPGSGPTTITVHVNQTSPLVLGSTATFESGTIEPTAPLVLPNIVVNATHTGSLDSTSASMSGSGTVVINGTKFTFEGASSLTFDGTLTTLTGNGVNLTGAISGAGILENTGGNNTISGANTSAGSSIIGGSLTLGNTNSLGTNGNAVSTGTVILPNAGTGSTKTYAQNFTVSGVGENSVGAIELGSRATVGSSVLSGALTITASSKLRTEGNGGTQTFAGAINVTAPSVTLELLTASGSVGVIANSANTAASIFEKTGTGTMRLNAGSTVTAANGVNLRAGVTKDNGAIVGNVTAYSGSNLGGSGTIAGTVLIRSGAILAPGNSPGILTQVSGNATLAGGSTFQAELGGTTAGNGNGFHDQYYVQNGSLTLDGTAGGVLLQVKSWVKADGVTTFTAQRRDVFSILRTSAGITGTFADISNPDYNTWMLYDNQGTAHTLGNLYGTGLLGSQTFAAYATAPWQSSILTSIWNQSVTASTSSTNANPAGFINSATLGGKAAVIVLTSDNLNRDLALMSPEAYLAISDFGLTVGRDVLGQALDNVSLWKEGNWIVGAGYSRSQHDYLGGSDAVSNYRLQAYSSLASVRYQLAPTWQVGAFFGYTDGQTKGSAASSKVHGNTFGLLADGTKTLAGRMVALRAAISFGDFTYDMSRNGSKATDQKMNTVAAELSASTDFYKSEKLSFGPAVGVAYGRAKTASFDEVGGVLPLNIAGGSSESVVTTAGLQLTCELTTAAVVTVKAGWEHEFADAADVGANFAGGAGSGFSASASQSRDTAVGGIDFGLRMPSACTLHLTAEVRDNRQFNRNYVLGVAVNRRF
ncbi:MAG: autotransporter domain-containing protein [Verrucomicrobia bacterium]|nr:autotransporter domain-containing protein [Verrucomicrobiota bacterium]